MDVLTCLLCLVQCVDALLCGELCILGRAEVHMAGRGHCHSGVEKERLAREA